MTIDYEKVMGNINRAHTALILIRLFSSNPFSIILHGVSMLQLPEKGRIQLMYIICMIVLFLSEVQLFCDTTGLTQPTGKREKFVAYSLMVLFAGSNTPYYLSVVDIFSSVVAAICFLGGGVCAWNLCDAGSDR
eukprot:GHVU01024383.1.p1 GENE.GHVU01024383.1~~GHVU01024383.1.p1  ORF type:complete len:134 (+),score=6.14 GHVU01024383.1:259-660(+)